MADIRRADWVGAVSNAASPNRVPWSEVAASAYRAYAASTGNKNFRGEPMPEFAALPRAIQVAWEAAVRHADAVLRCGAAYDLSDDERRKITDESRWAGWLPPDASRG